MTPNEPYIGGIGAKRRSKYRPNAVPDEMPPVPEWDNPALRRRSDDYGDAMRLRRAREAGAATSQPVVRRLIIARDESRCWICRRIVPESEIHLDHVTPLSRGGLHEPENVRVACAGCNLWKGSRIVTLDSGE